MMDSGNPIGKSRFRLSGCIRFLVIFICDMNIDITINSDSFSRRRTGNNTKRIFAAGFGLQLVNIEY